MLRILLACRPLPMATVPDFTALREKLATGNFFFFADPLGFDSPFKKQKKSRYLAVSLLFYLVEARGVEPLSESLSQPTSPSADGH